TYCFGLAILSFPYGRGPEDGFQVRAAIEPVSVHGVPVRLELPGPVPVAQGGRADAEQFGGHLYRQVFVQALRSWHRSQTLAKVIRPGHDDRHSSTQTEGQAIPWLFGFRQAADGRSV